MAEYFHIPPEGGWEENTYYVCEVSREHGNPIFEIILYSGSFSKVFNSSIDKAFSSLNDFRYVKAIRKIDMTIPNKGKQIKELNVFELKDHMKERPDVRFN